MSETPNGVKNKQPTGSSKRKRKHSIKRNIVHTETSKSESTTTSNSEKNNAKKIKVDKESNDEVELNSSRMKSVITIKSEINDRAEVQNCKNGGECSSTKERCQNCKFCTEHEDSQDSDGESKEKQPNSKEKFTCEVCAKDGTVKTFSTSDKHKQHLATAHEIFLEDIKRFECTDCPESVWFPTKAKFTYHLGTKHPGILRFVCDICTETFILKTNYKAHLKSHNIVVPKKYSCDVCNGTFVNKAGFESHKRRFPGPHIKQTCSTCGFSFSKEKHMKNHRCKALLLEAAAKATKTPVQVSPIKDVNPLQIEEDPLKLTTLVDVKSGVEKKIDKKSTNEENQNKRVVFHRIIPRRTQEQTVYRPVQVQSQNAPESVVVQELREIDLEGGTFIAAPANEAEQQFIVRDLNGHFLEGNQILQLDINDVQQEENQVYLADWNIVAPYVIREKSP